MESAHQNFGAHEYESPQLPGQDQCRFRHGGAPTGSAWGAGPPADENVEKVHVIFKTHLDIGFTDMAAKVIETYFEHFIPNVLSLTEQIEREHREDRYIWTTGSWLIYRYLEEASPENRRRMERAIRRGISSGTAFPSRCIPS